MPEQTLLALRALGLGDFLTALPALRALAESFPEHLTILAAPGWIAPLARFSGALDGFVEVGELEPLPEIEVDIAVNLHGSGPRSHRILCEVQPRRLIAFANTAVPATAGFPRWDPDEHEVQRWCRLLAEFGIRSDPNLLDLPRPEPAPERDRGATIVHPGAKSVSRRWPAERWAKVVSSELREGRRVLLTGNRRERALCLTIAEAAGLPREQVRAGSMTLLELASLVGSAGRVVCGDTGVAHLATALRTPSVVLFGPMSPGLWGPPPGRPEHQVIWKGLRGDPLGDAPDPGMLAITAGDVLDALATLPERSLAVEPRG
jgi:ADP-heptose:LPS heptosyltransferase